MQITVSFNLLFSKQLIIHVIISNYNLSSHQLGAKFNQNKPIQSADGTQTVSPKHATLTEYYTFRRRRSTVFFSYLNKQILFSCCRYPVLNTITHARNTLYKRYRYGSYDVRMFYSQILLVAVNSLDDVQMSVRLARVGNSASCA